MTSLVWYRNDLRIHDHEPLFEASKIGGVIPLYVFDPRKFKETTYGFAKTGNLRTAFLIQSVENLRKKFRKAGAELIIRVGLPEQIVPEIVAEAGVQQVVMYGEVTPEETEIEDAVENALSVPMKRYWGHSMFHRDDLPFNLLAIPDVFTQFRKEVEKKSRVRPPIEAPEQIRFPEGTDIEPGEIPAEKDLGVKKTEADSRAVLKFIGGEDEALKRLNSYFFETDSLRNYKFTRNGMLGADYSSKLSPWLANGCISARTIEAEVKRYENEIHKNVSTYWMIFELIWRDYFRYSAVKYGNRIFQLGGIQNKSLEKNTDPDLFSKWAEGRTGIPFIDANMRELNETGYMSNRGRQNVASFLAQNMDFDWRWGAAWFESKLLDYDVCSNWGNWAYNATVGHDPRNRYFNILNQADKYDKQGEYVRKWLPELKNVPKEFIHEPHLMSTGQQELFEVEIGRDYPKPILDLEQSYKRIRSES